MLLFPCAKLNLGLRILRKRRDGYHDLQTLFYPIPLYDVLEVLPSKNGMLWDDGGWSEGPQEDNLVMRAYQALKRECPTLPDVKIILRKRIPVGAGLGGGSSDAAFMLRALQELFRLGVSTEKLHELAKELGADVPFFLTPTPYIGEGIGDVLTPYPQLDLSGWYMTLFFPGIHISTAEAYAGVAPSEMGEDIRDILSEPVERWNGRLKNDFEKSIFPKYPRLAEFKEQLYNNGATYAAMTGSGSTLYALSRTPIVIEGVRNISLILTNHNS